MTPSNHAADRHADPLIGRIIAGRFRVLARIGRGAMGTVYSAAQLAMGRQVALKLMRPELASDPRMAQRFHREAKAACRIESPHVVTMFDFGQSEEVLFIAMELLDGESLAERLQRERRLAPSVALRIGQAIALALDAAHEAGVVHRDLKPDNVMLTRRGGVKVLDFGIAKMLEEEGAGGEEAPLTHVGMIVGTPLYMSPEAASRKPVGPPADLYALGVILFEMIVGRPPFEEDVPVLLLGMHLRVQPEHLREAAPGLKVPDDLERLVDELLAKKPEQRPPSAGAVAARLGRLASLSVPDDDPNEALGERAPSTSDAQNEPAAGARSGVQIHSWDPFDDAPTRVATVLSDPPPAFAADVADTTFQPQVAATARMHRAPAVAADSTTTIRGTKTKTNATVVLASAAAGLLLLLLGAGGSLVWRRATQRNVESTVAPTPSDLAPLAVPTDPQVPPIVPAVVNPRPTAAGSVPAAVAPGSLSAPPQLATTPPSSPSASVGGTDAAVPIPSAARAADREPRRLTRSPTPPVAPRAAAQPLWVRPSSGRLPPSQPAPRRQPQGPRIDSAEDIFGPSHR